MSTQSNKIRHFAQLIRKNPDDTFSKFALALELLKQNHVSKAQVLFESILKQDPEYLGVYYHLGKLYESKHETEKAESTFKAGISLSEKKMDTHTLSELRNALINLQSNMYDE